MLVALGLVVWSVAAPLQDPDSGVIRGSVRSEQTGQAVPYAVVEVASSTTTLRVTADSVGSYLVRGVPAGRRRVRARALDHAPLEVDVLVQPGREARVDFDLRFAPVPLVGLTVTGEVEERGIGGTDPGELGRAVVRSLEVTPGVAELGLTELSRVVGDGQDPADPTDVLYVRGAPADLRRVLLDGAPVYAPFQAGGLLQAFEPALMSRADLYLGGAPARYDGGLSYLLDLETRAGGRDRFRSSGTADLLTAQVMAEGPVGPRAGFLFGARTVHGGGASWLMNDPFPSGYQDLIGRVDVDMGRFGQLRATGYWNRESIDLGDEPSGRYEEAAWGNRAGALNYRGSIAGRSIEATAAAGLYRARLPLGNSIQRLMVDGSSRQTRLALDISEGDEGLRVNYGASYEETAITQRARALSLLAGEVSSTASGNAAGVYLDLDWEAAPRLRIRGGLRADHFSSTGMGTTQLTPRLALAWTISERAVLTLAGGRFRQLVRRGEEFEPASLDIFARAHDSGFRAAEASHLLIGLEQLLTDRVRLGIEGYYKRFGEMPTEFGLVRANTSGLDFWLRGSGGRLKGWAGYSLAWVWTGPTKAGNATDLFSGRQLLSLGATADLGGGGFLGLRLAYGAGVPYTAVPDGPIAGEMVNEKSGAAVLLANAREIVLESPSIASLPGAPDAPYLRLDAEFSYPLHTRWGGAPVTFTPYLKVYNALDRRDALFYRSDGAVPGSPRPLAALPVLPVFGFEWRF